MAAPRPAARRTRPRTTAAAQRRSSPAGAVFVVTIRRYRARRALSRRGRASIWHYIRMRKPAPADAVRRILAWAAPLVCLGVFACFYFPIRRFLSVGSPGVALVASDLLRRLPGLLHGNWSGSAIPLVDGFKHGPGEYYVSMLFILLWGHTPAAMFWRDGALAAIAIVTTYLLGWSLYRDRWAAFLAALILATSPGFVLYSMLGGLTGGVQVALAPASLYLLLRYADERKPWLAYAGCAALGFALLCRSTMAAFVLGLLVFAGLYRRAAVSFMPLQRAERRRFAWRCLLSFFLMLSPFVAACAFDLKGFWSYWGERLIVREEAGSNLDYWNNLIIRLGHVSRLLKGRDALHFFVEDPARYPASSQWFLAAAALGSAGYMANALYRRKPIAKRWFLPWVIAAVYLLISPFSPSRLRVMHLFPLLPLLYLAACAVIALPLRPRARGMIIASFLAFAASRVRAEIIFFRTFYAELARVGVWEPNLSAETLDLAERFSARPKEVPVFFGGPADTLNYVSGRSIDASALGDLSDAAASPSREAWDGVVRNENSRFVVTVEPGGASDESVALAALRAETSRRGLGLALEGAIKRPDGRPLFAIYRAER
jgi:hypothetical protein